MTKAKTNQVKVKMVNEHHDTRAAMISHDSITITKRQYHRVWKKLCGQKDCLCPADCHVKGKRVIIVPHEEDFKICEVKE